MWDWSWLDLDRLAFIFSHTSDKILNIYFQVTKQAGEFTPTDWNKHWQQGGDGAFMRGGRRHPRQDQGRRVVLLVLFSWSINSAQILILQLFLGGEGVVGGRGRDII